MNKGLFLFSLFIIFSLTIFAQKTDKEKSADIQFLKGQHTINIKYEYGGMLVGKMTELDFVQRKIEERNESLEGTGEEWHQKWETDKKERYPRRFELLINKYLESELVSVLADSNAKYTLIVKTLKIEPGFHVGVASQPALVDFEFLFVESKNPDKALLRLRNREVLGNASVASVDTGTRIGESYASAGKILAKYILKYAY